MFTGRLVSGVALAAAVAVAFLLVQGCGADDPRELTKECSNKEFNALMKGFEDALSRWEKKLASLDAKDDRLAVAGNCNNELQSLNTQREELIREKKVSAEDLRMVAKRLAAITKRELALLGQIQKLLK